MFMVFTELCLYILTKLFWIFQRPPILPWITNGQHFILCTYFSCFLDKMSNVWFEHNSSFFAGSSEIIWIFITGHFLVWLCIICKNLLASTLIHKNMFLIHLLQKSNNSNQSWPMQLRCLRTKKEWVSALFSSHHPINN